MDGCNFTQRPEATRNAISKENIRLISLLGSNLVRGLTKNVY